MPKIKLATIQGNKGKVLMKFDTPYKERGPLFQINTKKFVRLMTENPEDRDFYLEDQNLTYDQLLIMVVLKIPFTRWMVTRLIDIFGVEEVEEIWERAEVNW